MKMIWSVVRWDRVQLIARELKSVGVSGCTTYPVRGYGKEWHLYEPLIHGGHYKLEAIVEDAQVETAVKKITEHGSTGLAGDGVLCVLDLGPVVNICSKQEVKNSESETQPS